MADNVVNSGLSSSALLPTMQGLNEGSNWAVHGLDPFALGAHAAQPFSTPKYSLHSGQRSEYTDTMARMFIEVPPGLYKAFRRSLYRNTQDGTSVAKDTEMVRIADALVGDNQGGGGAGYIDFFLQRAHHSFNDKYQVTETLSDNFVAFFFGMQAPVFSYTGVLLNTYQDYWAARMLRIFTEFGRGTQLARRKFVMRLRYDNLIVSGAMINFDWDILAENEMACPFSFNLLVTRVDLLFGGMTDPSQPVPMSNSNKFAPSSDANVFGGSEARLNKAIQSMMGAPSTAAAQPGGVTQNDDYQEFNPPSASDDSIANPPQTIAVDYTSPNVETIEKQSIDEQQSEWSLTDGSK